MDERNCGFCQPCANGRYNECETRNDENDEFKFRDALYLIRKCLKMHKNYSSLANGYLEEADEIISRALKNEHDK